MVFKCSVPSCRGNYKNGPKVSVFSLPKNEELLRKWLKAIPRENINPSKNFKVCELHFNQDDIRRTSEYYDTSAGQKVTANLTQPRIKDDAVPSVFPGCPSYLSKYTKTREAPKVKALRKENEQLQKALKLSVKSLEEEEMKISFKNLNELLKVLKNYPYPDEFTFVNVKNSVMFLKISSSPVPELSLSVLVNENLEVSPFYYKIPVTEHNGFKFPMQITNVKDLLSILHEFINYNGCLPDKLNNLKSLIKNIFHELKPIVPENYHDLINLLQEQINLIGINKAAYRYSADLLVLSSLLHSISPHAYRFLRNGTALILPHPNTLNRLISSFNLDPRIQTEDDNFLKYAKDKFKFLNNSDKIVNLMMDEIHLKPFLDYKCGDIIGASYNSGKAANSAFVFMVQSLKSAYKDVIHILPVKTISAELLHEIIRKIIIKLSNIGYNVIVLSSDNNAINKKAVGMFANPPKLSICYLHPADSSKPLFFVIDQVHLLKSVRNNWLNQKNPEQAMFYPSFYDMPSNDKINKTASFHSLKKLYEIEMDGQVKCAYTLTSKSLCPTNLERQNVRLALNIFNLSVCESLKLVGVNNNILNAVDTAEYIKIIVTWFDIMNVKSVFKGYHKRNIYQEPLTSNETNEAFLFLYNFLDWLEKWEGVNMQTGRLSRETLQALKITTYAVIEITKYCINELQFEYILPGKLQTDFLESRFGKYRQLAGCQYNVSLTQVYEVEKKLRLQSMLPLVLKSDKQGEVTISLIDDSENYKFDLNIKIPPLLNEIYVSSNDIEDLNALLPALVYVAGYCVHSLLKNIKCSICKSLLLVDRDIVPDESCFMLIKNLDRGGLKYPIDNVTTVVIHNYVIISKLVSQTYESTFLKIPNKRSIACKLTIEILDDTENYLPLETCSNGHTPFYLCKEIVKKSTNTFLKSYCKKINDKLNFTAIQNKKRKLMTLNPV